MPHFDVADALIKVWISYDCSLLEIHCLNRHQAANTYCLWPFCAIARGILSAQKDAQKDVQKHRVCFVPAFRYLSVAWKVLQNKGFYKNEGALFRARVPTYALKTGKRGWAMKNKFLLYRHTILPGLLTKKTREHTVWGEILQFRQRSPHQAENFSIFFVGRVTCIL